MQVPISPHPRQHLLSVFLIIVFLVVVRWYLIVGFCKDFICLFLERGKGGRQRRRETSMFGCLLRAPGPCNQACALTGNRTGNPLVCRLVFHPWSHTWPARAHCGFDLHFHMSSGHFHIFFWRNVYSDPLLTFSVGLFVILLLCCKSSSYTLDTSPLSDL